MPTRTRVIGTAIAAAAIVAVATPAWAHVTVTATDAKPGATDVELTFRVPNEKPTARTTAVAVRFPLDTPIADVLVAPTPGWTFTERTARLAKPIVTDDGDVTEAVAEIDWRATGRGIGAGEFGAFTVIAGQLPDATSLTFKAVQSYSDGSTVSWIELPAPGSTADVEHPAPALTLTAPQAVAKTSTHSDGTGAVGIAALVVACLGVALAGVAVARR